MILFPSILRVSRLFIAERIRTPTTTLQHDTMVLERITYLDGYDTPDSSTPFLVLDSYLSYRCVEQTPACV